MREMLKETTKLLNMVQQSKCCKHLFESRKGRVSSYKKVQVGKDQEKAQSEKDSHSKYRGGKNQTNNQVLVP